MELLIGLIVPVVFASLPEIFTIQPTRAGYVMRILIVEDETLIALSTQADLETAGHSVEGLAMTSEEAINLAAWCRPDLVLMDIRLAEGNAVEVAQAIHTRWAIPSLLATSHVENSAATCHAALGCLRKPYDDRSLVRSIQIVEQVMNGFEPTLSRPHNLELYQNRIKQSKCSLPGKSAECHSPSAVQNNAGA